MCKHLTEQKWNKALFKEMHTAFQNGRSDKDPSLGWYDGEIWFFDNYVVSITRVNIAWMQLSTVLVLYLIYSLPSFPDSTGRETARV
jgi:hypothetical protein